MSKNVIYDIESYPNFFLYGDYDYVQKRIVYFEISSRINRYEELREYLLRGDIDWQIGFNNIEYDYLMLHFLLSRNLHHYSGREIAEMLNIYSNKIINSQRNNDPIRPIAFNKQKIKQLDLKKIWHFDNKAKLVSLKWIQFMIDWKNVEDLPFEPNTFLSWEQMDKVIEYWTNDIDSTNEFFNITVGKTELPLYKGKNKIQLRKDVIEKYGIPCHNYNDVKIGEQLMLRDYMKETKLSYNEIKELKPNYYDDEFTFGDCFPSYVSFKTEKFQKFAEYIKKIKVDIKSKDDDKKSQKFEFEHKGTRYTIAKGGIHSVDLPRFIKPLSFEILRDADVGLICGPSKIA